MAELLAFGALSLYWAGIFWVLWKLARYEHPPAPARHPDRGPALPPSAAGEPGPKRVRLVLESGETVELLDFSGVARTSSEQPLPLELGPVEAPSPTAREVIAARPHWWSADTTPEAFAVPRALWVAPSFLLLYAGLSAAIVPLLSSLTEWYAGALAVVTGRQRWELLAMGGSLSFRPFLALLILLLSIFAVGSWAQRLKLLLFAWTLYAATILLVDATLVRYHDLWTPWPFAPVGGIVAGLAGLVVIIVTVFSRYLLPTGIRVLPRRRRSRLFLLVFLTCVGLAIAITVGFSWAREEYFDGLHIRFIGGLDSNLVIFLLALVILLFVASATLEHGKPTHGPRLSVAFLIPAHNEARDLGECIRAIDAAAAGYGGDCELYVVDNDSSDDTARVARAALAKCHNIKGDVLHCPTPGKARALNLGLSRITQDVVIRIDADTMVSPSLLDAVLPWFWDESVGGVSGLPLPNEATPRWLYPLRIAEVYYGVAFLRVAQGAADAIMVMPGMIAAYRRALVEELGGFAEGINGEDADITMRIGRLGYRIVTDLDVHVRTEVPETLAHLREQRQRWARGLFHMAGRNMSIIWMRQGLRGLWILPWSIFNASRRSMMIPILVCAFVVELLDPTVFALREISVVAGFLIGLQLVVISVLLLAYRQFAAMPFVPAYLLFRMFRAYTAFETLLTLRLKQSTAGAGAATTPGGGLSGARPST
jgi:cellulose synthase/poly-beta-1,6-N-acetylglucosamine synthase-like glycosyltransferase